MNKKGHLMVGLLVCSLFIFLANLLFDWYFFDIKSIAIYIIIILIYCLMPDIDSKSSTIVWFFIPLSIIGMAYGYYTQNNIIMISFFSLLVITFISASWMPHRGFIHSILFGIVVSAPLFYFFSYQESILGFIAFYSHLIADEEYFKII
jgi:membrane-bound metal-dependent hydrolase YbcI (DUF457 family)